MAWALDIPMEVHPMAVNRVIVTRQRGSPGSPVATRSAFTDWMCFSGCWIIASVSKTLPASLSRTVTGTPALTRWIYSRCEDALAGLVDKTHYLPQQIRRRRFLNSSSKQRIQGECFGKSVVEALDFNKTRYNVNGVDLGGAWDEIRISGNKLTLKHRKCSMSFRS